MNRDLGLIAMAFGAMWALDAAPVLRSNRRKRRVRRNSRPPLQQALDRYASLYCGSLVEIAIDGSVSPETRERLQRQKEQAEGAGATARRIRGVEKWCDREMVPKLKKLYGVDVRRQMELF